MTPLCPSFSKTLLALLWLLSAALYPLHALSQTLEPQPIEVEADSLEIDKERGIGTYRGGVVLVQGSIRLEADRLQILTEENRLERLVATGDPVRFRQQDDAGEWVLGSSREIEYRPREGRLVFSREARLEQDRARFESDRIVYDTRLKRLQAGEISRTQGGRVRMVLDPR